MTFLRLLRALFLALAPLLTVTSVARAQVFEAFVSGVGDDANTCTRTLPCRTFAGAFLVTLPGGIISALDPGDFGPVTVTHSISIEGHGVADILANGTHAITITAGPSDVVVLRGLTLDGLGSFGGNGILVRKVGSLLVEDSEIRNFGSDGILFVGYPPQFDARAAAESPDSSPNAGNSTSPRSNTEHNVVISNTQGVGISIGSIGDAADIGLTTVLKQVTITGNLGGGFLLDTRQHTILAATHGGEVTSESRTQMPSSIKYNATVSNTANLVDCVISGNSGFGGVSVLDLTPGSQQPYEHNFVFVNNSSVVGNNGAGLMAQGIGTVITMSNVEISTNTTGIASLLGGQLISFGNNRKVGNVTDGA